MKKTWVGIISICLGACAVAGGFYYGKTNSTVTNKITMSNAQLNNNGQNNNLNGSNSTLNNENESSTYNSGTENSNQTRNTGELVNNSNSSEVGQGNQEVSNNKNNSQNNDINNSKNITVANQSIPSSLLNYMGVWTPTKEVSWNRDYTKNIIPTQEELNNDKLILTEVEYSFGGEIINNPSYKLITVSQQDIFANMQMGGYGPVSSNGNKSNQGNESSPSSGITFIVPIPQGASNSYIQNMSNPSNLIKYPYISCGNLCQILNAQQRPIYEFTK